MYSHRIMTRILPRNFGATHTETGSFQLIQSCANKVFSLILFFCSFYTSHRHTQRFTLNSFLMMFCSIFLSAGLPSDTYNIWWPYSYPLNQSFCILQGLLSETSTNATVLTITSFTIERYIAICHPFRLVPICYAINIHYLGYILSVFGVLGANGKCRTPLTMALLLLLNLLMHARIQSIYVKFSCVTELNACSSILHRRIARLKKCRIIARHADITNNIAGDDRVASRKHCEGIADNHHKFYDYRAIRRSS